MMLYDEFLVNMGSLFVNMMLYDDFLVNICLLLESMSNEESNVNFVACLTSLFKDIMFPIE